MNTSQQFYVTELILVDGTEVDRPPINFFPDEASMKEAVEDAWQFPETVTIITYGKIWLQ